MTLPPAKPSTVLPLTRRSEKPRLRRIDKCDAVCFFCAACACNGDVDRARECKTGNRHRRVVVFRGCCNHRRARHVRRDVLLVFCYIGREAVSAAPSTKICDKSTSVLRKSAAFASGRMLSKLSHTPADTERFCPSGIVRRSNTFAPFAGGQGDFCCIDSLHTPVIVYRRPEGRRFGSCGMIENRCLYRHRTACGGHCRKLCPRTRLRKGCALHQRLLYAQRVGYGQYRQGTHTAGR